MAGARDDDSARCRCSIPAATSRLKYGRPGPIAEHAITDRPIG
jgi:hypothetical protein